MSIGNSITFISRHPLTRQHRLAAVKRIVKWQIISRLVPGDVVVDWVGSSRFLARRGETGLTGNIYAGLHEFEDMGFLLHFLREDDFFVDVGANSGSYTVLAGSAAGASGIAFEPVPDSYKRLIANVRLNNMDERVRCFNMGIGAKQDTMEFTADRDTTNHLLVSGETCEKTVAVKITSLDEALAKCECPTLLKIDVEGYETPVLQGADSLLRNHLLRAVIMELNGSGSRYGFDELQLHQLMLDHEFKAYTYSPFSRTLVDLSGKNNAAGNTLYIRDKPFVVDRLKKAEKISIHGLKF